MRKNKYILPFFLLATQLFISLFAFAQRNKIDSLLYLLKKDKEDTNKMNHLNKISRLYEFTGAFDSATFYCNEALRLADILPNGMGIMGASVAYNNLGVTHFDQGNYSKALEYYFKALKKKEEIKDKNGIATVYGNIGNTYSAYEEYAKGLEYYMKAMKIGEEIGDSLRVGIQLSNIGIVYFNLGEYSKALEYYFRALKIAELKNILTLQAALTGNIGNVYLEQAKLLNNENGSRDSLNRKALVYCLKALKMVEKLESKNGITIYLGNIGLLYMQMKNYKEAEIYLQKSLMVAEEIGSLDDIKGGHMNLSALYEEMNNSVLALKHFRQYAEAKDSIFNEEKDKEITRKEMNYEFEKKETATKAEHDKKMALAEAESRKQKIIRNSIGGGLAVVLLFSLVVYRQRNRISKEKKRSDELLLNILPSETAEELKLTGHAEPKQFDRVTVLFTDFKGFTQIAEKMSAKELVGELDFIFKKFDEIISGYPIEKIKTIGDAYMCAGGLPTANTTNAMDVTLAALEIQDFMQSHNARQASENKPVFEIRIGIHTGPIVAGIVGIKKFAYDIWGDTVNTASRMESSGEAGKVNISGTTHKYLSEIKEQTTSLKFSYRGKVQVKNKKDIEMFFVERA